jgi:uncharacterized MAPEG superfamily protein
MLSLTWTDNSVLFLCLCVVTARPLTPQGNRMQSESPRPQLLGQKPIAATQTSTQVNHEELFYIVLSA